MRNFALPLRPLMFIAAAVLFHIATPSPLWAQERLTLEKAVQTALANRPELKPFANDIQAAQARAEQAQAWQNPELELETSNLFEENTVGISQTIELAGKRRARAKAETTGIPLIENERDRARLDVIDEVSQAYVALLGAQEKLALVTEAHATAGLFANTVAERVAAGAVSPIEETRAKVLLAGASTELGSARRELEEARIDLAAAIGALEDEIGTAEGKIPTAIVVPDKSALLAASASNPDLVRWKFEYERHNAMLDSELASNTPDFTLTGKFTLAEESENNAVTAGISFPLNYFNKNRGAITTVEMEREKLQYAKRADEQRLKSQISKRHANLKEIAAQVDIVRDQMLANAQKAFEAVSEGYRQGKFRYLDVLDATNELNGAKLKHLELLISFELEKTALNRLVSKGTGIEEK